MLKSALAIAAKDLHTGLARGSALVQALLLGLLIIFVFSLSQGIGETLSPQGAAAVFWTSSAFCMVLVFTGLYAAEEANGTCIGLLLMPAPPQAVWLGKAAAGLVLLLCAQLVFLPASVVFLGQHIGEYWLHALGTLALADIGMAAVGSLLGALSRGRRANESLLSILVFPLLIPLLLAGIRMGAGAFCADLPEGASVWPGIAAAFDALFCGAALVLFGHIYTGDD